MAGPKAAAAVAGAPSSPLLTSAAQACSVGGGGDGAGIQGGGVAIVFPAAKRLQACRDGGIALSPEMASKRVRLSSSPSQSPECSKGSVMPAAAAGRAELVGQAAATPTAAAAASEEVPSPSEADGGAADAVGGLTTEQRVRMTMSRAAALARKNMRLAEERVAASRARGEPYPRLAELLVEPSWLDAVGSELHKPYAERLCQFVHREGASRTPVYPPPAAIFAALNSTPFDAVRVIIIGQDPYHRAGQAMGLSFSVPVGVRPPSSLANIFTEVASDVGCTVSQHGDLTKWTAQGVLLLNACLTGTSHLTLSLRTGFALPLANLPSSFNGQTVLTVTVTVTVGRLRRIVRERQANSHAKRGWEPFTDEAIRQLSARRDGLVFLLWGNAAQDKARLIDTKRHHALKAAHPSGFSAHKGFFGCKHFSKTNELLEAAGQLPIDWQL
eukprot:SM000183S04008  [mRNA]  locus=s183:101023:104252:- [translate_table: standard]